MGVGELLHVELCPRCSNWVRWPSLTNAELVGFVALVRKGRLLAARHAHASFGLDLDGAKLLAFHVCDQPERCHRCGSGIEGEVSVCGNCHALNLDW